MKLSRLLARSLRRNQRGAAAVEMALCLPIVAVLFTGVADYGLAFNSSRQIGTVSTAAARQGAAGADDRLADFAVLRVVKGALGDDGALTRVIVYKANSLGTVPAACFTANVTGVCNSYTAAQVRTLTAADFTQVGCAGDPDVYWCPTSRRTAFQNGDYLGVAVVMNRDPVFGSLGVDEIVRKSSFRLEVRNP